MNANEKTAFAQLMGTVSGYYGSTLNKAQVEVYWHALGKYALADIERAAWAHIGDDVSGKWMPKVSDIVAQMKAALPHDGHPTADQAWGVVARIIGNETETAFLTEPMREAWQACSAIISEMQDEVGARRCFIDSYNAGVSKARQAGITPKWLPTIGTDPEKRAEAARAALAANQITQEQANALLPAPEPARVMGLLEASANAAKDPETAKKGLEALKAAIQRMETRAARQEQERLAELAREREELQRLKDEAVAALLEKENNEKAA